MSNIFSIAVDTNIRHNTHEKSVQQILLKFQRNVQSSGLHIINE